MLSYSQGVTFHITEQPFKSYPWEWLYRYQAMPFSYAPRYTAAVSFTVFALMIPTFLYLIYRAAKKDDAALFGAGWFISTYIIWIPAVLLTDRVTYIYYFYPAVGAICLGMGIWMSQLLDFFHRRAHGKLKWFALSVVIFVLVAHVFSFLILSPVIQADFVKLVGINIIAVL